MSAVIILPLLVGAYFARRWLRNSGVRPRARYIALGNGAITSIMVVTGQLSNGARVAPAIGFGLAVFLVASAAGAVTVLILNQARGEDHKHYYPW